MNLNSKLAKIGLYLLSKETKEENLPYSLVGGLAVQVYAYNHYKDQLRPTIDADISVENMGFKKFKRKYGDGFSKLAKNKFGLGSHIENSHNGNTVRLIQHGRYNQKDMFWLHFNRYQPELYERIKEKLLYDIEHNSESINLSDVDITNQSIKTKSNIYDANNLELKVLNVEEILKHKLGKIMNKSNQSKSKLSEEYEKLRGRIMNEGMSFKPRENVQPLYEQILNSHATNEENYFIEKDVYDFFLLNKVFS
jgi:hypothetical protein